MNRTPEQVRGKALTAREQEILLLVMEGETIRAIARRLGNAHSTIEAHLYYARHKLGARSLPHAVALFMRQQYRAQATASVQY